MFQYLYSCFTRLKLQKVLFNNIQIDKTEYRDKTHDLMAKQIHHFKRSFVNSMNKIYRLFITHSEFKENNNTHTFVLCKIIASNCCIF